LNLEDCVNVLGVPNLKRKSFVLLNCPDVKKRCYGFGVQ
jgi:hypothetical protein